MWPFSRPHDPEGSMTPAPEPAPAPEGDKAKFERLRAELEPFYRIALQHRDTVPGTLFAQMAAYVLEQPHYSNVDAHVDILGIEETLAEARKLLSTPSETAH